MVLPGGTVMWFTPARLKAYCMLDMSNFPFDEQTCYIVFGPWAHDSTQVSEQNTTCSRPFLLWMLYTTSFWMLYTISLYSCI